MSYFFKFQLSTFLKLLIMFAVGQVPFPISDGEQRVHLWLVDRHTVYISKTIKPTLCAPSAIRDYELLKNIWIKFKKLTSKKNHVISVMLNNALKDINVFGWTPYLFSHAHCRVQLYKQWKHKRDGEKIILEILPKRVKNA